MVHTKALITLIKNPLRKGQPPYNQDPFPIAVGWSLDYKTTPHDGRKWSYNCRWSLNQGVNKKVQTHRALESGARGLIIQGPL